MGMAQFEVASDLLRLYNHLHDFRAFKAVFGTMPYRFTVAYI